MVAALRRLGFDAVFDTNFTADLTIIEEGTELLTRLKKALVEGEEVALPMFTSCSPGWINYMEHYNPDMLANLSTCKSPQQMFGALAKTYYPKKLGMEPKNIVVVSVMPCTAKKFECARPEMGRDGVQDVDFVLTTRELARMIKQAGIDFRSLPEQKMDKPLGISTGAADIFAATGGVMEAALRTAYEIVTGTVLPVRQPARDSHRRVWKASRKPRSPSRRRCRSGRSSRAPPSTSPWPTVWPTRRRSSTASVAARRPTTSWK